MAKVLTDNRHYYDIADAIRDNYELMGQIFPSEMADAINQACNKQHEKGKQEEADKWWDALQLNGTRTNYMYALYMMGSIDLSPKYPFNITNAFWMFGYFKPINDEFNLDFDLTNASSINSMFYGSGATKIQKVILKSDGSQSVTEFIRECPNLEEIRFEGIIGSNFMCEKSAKLSNDSVDSIINALKEGAGKSITFHKDIQLTDTQKATITGKGWSIAQ